MDTRHPTARFKLVAGAIAAIAALIAIGATGAIAASRAFSPSDESKAVIDDAARQLGVEPSALSSALKRALENRIDEAVEAGRLSEEQGAALKERIRSAELPFFGGFGHKGFGFGLRFGHRGREHLATAVTFLGLSEAELRSRLAQGATLADVAKEEGKSVDGLVAALVRDVESKIDEAVADGRLTEEQGAEAKERVSDRVSALVNGELRPPGFGRWREAWPGFRGRPWHGDRPGD
ncbi:MAG: hypothetical protein KatS3mg012_1702 [Gaiellaceae bacterium]|jgi:polyhydroxyalkanoate synthesis regulator phasin|nr:MAG: hypothetical protein KatS3mg012_1702 [Gaiellaceae bacterium]